MKRFYLSKMMLDESGEFPVRRPKAQMYPGLNTVVVSSDSSDFALVLVSGVNHTQLLADPDIDDLPDFPLDVKMNSMQAATRNKMVASLGKHGIDSSIVTGADGFRDVVRSLGRSLDPSFDENNFDVAE